jgi:transcriptional regulator with XRE-family HTH domain
MPQRRARSRTLPQEREAGATALTQDAHALPEEANSRLERTIGQQVRRHRQEMAMTLLDLARTTGLSLGMLSKIENGQISASLATLRALSGALNVPITALFHGYDKRGGATYVKAGSGLDIQRRGTRAGHQYQLLGHGAEGPVTVEPYLITLTRESDVFPLFQHEGLELIYLLVGKVGYRHGDRVYTMEPGDSLFFDATVNHGPELLLELPIRLLSVISYVRG